MSEMKFKVSKTTDKLYLIVYGEPSEIEKLAVQTMSVGNVKMIVVTTQPIKNIDVTFQEVKG